MNVECAAPHIPSGAAEIAHISHHTPSAKGSATIQILTRNLFADLLC